MDLASPFMEMGDAGGAAAGGALGSAGGRLGSDPPSSGGAAKMVSLADLHVGSPPVAPPLAGGGAAPGGGHAHHGPAHHAHHHGHGHGHGHGRASPLSDAPHVDALDPMLQQLVQDRHFIAAVQTGALHAAAAAAVRLLRGDGGAHAAGPPARGARGRGRAAHAAAGDHHHHHHHHHHHRGGGGGGGDALESPRAAAPRGGGAAAAAGVAAALGPAMRALRSEVLALEEDVPWDCVRKAWRTKRSAWRRQVKTTDSLPEFGRLLRELRGALLAGDGELGGCGPLWRAALDGCAAGRGSVAQLVAAWDELAATIRAWLGAGGGPGAEAAAARGVRALQAGARGGSAALLQAPLEAIVGGDSAALHAVRQSVELERRAVAAALAAHGQRLPDAPAPPAPRFRSIAAPWDDSDFDSGAGSAMEDDGSDATDLAASDF